MTKTGRSPARTNLVTGFLGVGKTTVIRSLLAGKPKEERWAVLVNEFGDIGIDEAALGADGQDGIAIREIPGGCICCTSSLPMTMALRQLLMRERPDRLLIEPTGLGHPAGIIDMLREAEESGAISLGPTLCLVDPRRLEDARLHESEVFQDQVHLSDILLAAKGDLADAGTLVRFEEWARALFPPKLHIGQVDKGAVDSALLDLDNAPIRVPLFPEAHASGHAHAHGPTTQTGDVETGDADAPAPDHPVRRLNRGLGQVGCGWIFDPSERFHRRALLELLSGDLAMLGKVTRLKGVFRTGRSWMLVNRVAEEFSVQSVVYRRDSRIEILCPDPGEGEAGPDWDRFATALLETRRD